MKEELNPIKVGKKVLEERGYTVEVAGFGYNSLEIIVKDKRGNVVFGEVYGS
jgi:hypothetical protein